MTTRQKKFAEAYAHCGNGTAAAITAGYSPKAARFTGAKLLRNVAVSAYIEELQAEIRSEEIASAHEIKKFWTEVMFDESQKMTDRLNASNYLAKSSGLFLDQPSVVVNAGIEDSNDVVIYLPEIDRIEGCEQREGDS